GGGAARPAARAGRQLEPTRLDSQFSSVPSARFGALSDNHRAGGPTSLRVRTTSSLSPARRKRETSTSTLRFQLRAEDAATTTPLSCAVPCRNQHARSVAFPAARGSAKRRRNTVSISTALRGHVPRGLESTIQVAPGRGGRNPLRGSRSAFQAIAARTRPVPIARTRPRQELDLGRIDIAGIVLPSAHAVRSPRALPRNRL